MRPATASSGRSRFKTILKGLAYAAILGILGLYAFYLFYLGASPLMKVPAERAVTYTVAAGQNANPLDYTSTSALTLNGGTINDTAGNPANRTLPPSAAAGRKTRNVVPWPTAVRSSMNPL